MSTDPVAPDPRVEHHAPAEGTVLPPVPGPRRARARAPEPSPPAPRRAGPLEAVIVGLLLLVVAQRWVVDALDIPALQTWATFFVSIVVQAMPFLVLGVLLSATIAVLVPASVFTRALPSRPALAVPVAGVAGAALPGCECASVPVAGSLVARGVTPAAALAFLLSAPAINPVVLVSTAVAFPGRPEMVGARFGASLLTAVVMGWLWLRLGRASWMRVPRYDLGSGGKAVRFRMAVQHDFLHAGGFLVVGGIVAATVNVVLPPEVMDYLSENPWVAVLAFAVLAVLVAICSEADAFVAASFNVHPVAQLAFLVVGPAVDVKLISLQAGTFGRAFAARFAPATFVVAVLAATGLGWWLL